MVTQRQILPRTAVSKHSDIPVTGALRGEKGQPVPLRKLGEGRGVGKGGEKGRKCVLGLGDEDVCADKGRTLGLSREKEPPWV